MKLPFATVFAVGSCVLLSSYVLTGEIEGMAGHSLHKRFMLDLLQSGAEERSDESAAAMARRRVKRVATTPDRFWQNCIVPYVIDSAQSDRDIRNYRTAMDFVSHRTCITFVPWDENTKDTHHLDHNGYVLLKKEPSGWGFASLGNTKKPKQQISCTDRENCVHELLHALGFDHEQKDARRNGILRINWKNILPSLLSQYKEASNPNENKSEPYDVTTTMHYRLQIASDKPEMTLLFSDLSIQRGSYYQLRDVALKYQCKERFCSDVDLECDNDGYVVSQRGVCQCICPDGLDPATGCTSIRHSLNSNPFPGGKFGLPEPAEGCPQGENFLSGSLDHSFPYAYATSPFRLKGQARGGHVVQWFCMKDEAENDFPWPSGAYCIYQSGGHCPKDFDQGWIQFDNKYTSGDATSAKTDGAVPDGEYGENTKLFFCCRQDGSPRVPAVLPNTQPFVLFPVGSRCQRVEGAKDYRGDLVLTMDTGDGVFGYSAAKPYTYQRSNANTKLYLRYCAYHHAKSDCGGIITLSEAKRKEIITSPNYPDDYDNNLECHWFITGPVNSTVTLTFHDFDIEGVPGKCKDSVEISTYMFAENGNEYCGKSMQKTHRSILNALHVILHTGVQGQRSGFKATVEVHLGEENCFNPNDYGSSYRGKIAFAEDFTKCLDWNDPALKLCHHFATNPLDINAGLDSNYCRNPGDGVRPWCYTNAADCKRTYCDVCQLGTAYDRGHLGDCAALIAADDSYCRNSEQARENCASTCADQLPAVETPVPFRSVQCPAPAVPDDGSPKDAPLADSYTVGDKVTFVCSQPSSTWQQTTTCLGDGTWTPLGSVCTGCPDGWHPFRDSCYWAAPQPATFTKAQEACEKLGAELAEIRDQAIMDFFFRLRDSGADQWIGLKQKDKGNWIWQDGTSPVFTKWTTEKRRSEKDSRNTEYCATLRFTDFWTDLKCKYKSYFNCRRVLQEAPPVTVEKCVDKRSRTTCSYWKRKRYCVKYPKPMKTFCPNVCELCPAKPECEGKPCGENKCVVVGANKEYACSCSVGYYGEKCDKKFPCIDRASRAVCGAKVNENPSICEDFPEFAWFLCKRSCGLCPAE